MKTGRLKKRITIWVSEQAGISIPKQYENKEDIDTLVMVKLHHKHMTLERGFFTAASPEEFDEKAQRLLDRDIITQGALRHARIEQYIIGPVFNFNFFYSPIDDEVELLGIDFRFESNLDGLVRIPAAQQLEIAAQYRDPLMVIVGHANASLRESLLEKVLHDGGKIRNIFKAALHRSNNRAFLSTNNC